MLRRLIILLLIVGCDNSTDSDIHPLVGVWLGAEREHYSVNQVDTSSVMVGSTNLSWTFKEDFIFSGWNEQSIPNPEDTLSYTGIWSVFQNQLTLTFVIDEETEISIFDYIINNRDIEYFNIYRDSDQNIEIVLLNKEMSPIIELIFPIGEDNPLNQFLMNGQNTSPYHIAYEVNNINDSIKFLRSKGFIPCMRISKAVAFNNVPFIFLANNHTGLIELLEIND